MIVENIDVPVRAVRLCGEDMAARLSVRNAGVPDTFRYITPDGVMLQKHDHRNCYYVTVEYDPSGKAQS
jgi:hypothetical protein